MSKQDLPDLIPDEFGGGDFTPPVRFLHVQEESLSKKTGGLIEAKIRMVSSGADFLHTFMLFVRSLDFYTYNVFTLKQPIQFYPLTIENHLGGPDFECPDESAYVKALTDIFSSQAFKRVVAALIAEVKESAK